ncbi:unnamed protein product, partial [Ectocarpus sp. 12 AP-2014]
MTTIFEQTDRDGDQRSHGVLPCRGIPSEGSTEEIAMAWLPQTVFVPFLVHVLARSLRHPVPVMSPSLFPTHDFTCARMRGAQAASASGNCCFASATRQNQQRIWQ